MARGVAGISPDYKDYQGVGAKGVEPPINGLSWWDTCK